MKVSKYIIIVCLYAVFSSLTNPVSSQSIDLLLGSENDCMGELEVGIFVRASSFSVFDFKIGSASIFLDFDPTVVSYSQYEESNFTIQNDSTGGWLNHELNYDNECGLFSLVIQLDDASLNQIYVSKQATKKIGEVSFTILDPASDPNISIRPELTTFNEAVNNDGSASIPILTVPKVLDYSCIEDCDASPLISNVVVIPEDCFTGEPGRIDFNIQDDPLRDSIEISIDGGFTYDLTFADNSLMHSITALYSGYYNLYVRWQNDQCPTMIGNYYIQVAGGPQVTVSLTDDCNAEGTATILFTFPNQLPVVNSLAFSTDGGFSFDPIVADNSGSYTFENMPIGQYHCVTQWGDGSCQTDLGYIDIIPHDYPTLSIRNPQNCLTRDAVGAIMFDIADNPTYSQLDISIDGGRSFPYSLHDHTGTYGIYDLREGSYKIHAKWKNESCSYDYGTVYIKQEIRNYNVTADYSPASCTSFPDGNITILLETDEPAFAEISIDGGQTYHLTDGQQFQFIFDNLMPGDYPVFIKWQYCTEFYDLIRINEATSCPSCFDGIKNGDETYIDCGGSACVSCYDCQQNIDVTAQEIDVSIHLRAIDKIEAKGIIGENIQVKLQAGSSIQLFPEFEVSINSTFHAFIEDCN